ncbi:MAG: PH domain-containing protein [Planctomycetota bacterium]
MPDERDNFEHTETPEHTPEPAQDDAASPAAESSQPAPRNADEPDRAVEAGYPPDSGPEQPVLTVHEAMFRARPGVFLLDVAAMLASLYGVFWFRWGKEEPWAWASWTCLGAIAVVGLGLGFWKLKSMTKRLEITNKRTVRQVGLFSRDSSEVLHDNIRNVTIQQSLWERIWGVGRVGIASSGSDEIEIDMERVPTPRKVQKIIDLYRPLG